MGKATLARAHDRELPNVGKRQLPEGSRQGAVWPKEKKAGAQNMLNLESGVRPPLNSGGPLALELIPKTATRGSLGAHREL